MRSKALWFPLLDAVMAPSRELKDQDDIGQKEGELDLAYALCLLQRHIPSLQRINERSLEQFDWARVAFVCSTKNSSGSLAGYLDQ